MPTNTAMNIRRSSLVFALAAWTALACTEPSPLRLAEPESSLSGLTGTVSITLAAPKGVPVMSPVLLGANSMDIRSGAIVETGTVVSMGSAGMAVANDALLNDAWSVGPVGVLARANIRGTLHATRATLENGAIVPSWDRAPVFTPNSVLSWKVTYPAVPSTNDVTVYQGGSAPVAPGAYRSIIIYSGGTATMSTGTYYLSKLDLEPSSKLLIDQTAGPVLIYISDVLIHRGSISSTSGAMPEVLLGYLGTSEAVIESLFRGAIVSPNAQITIRAVGATHVGYFAGKSISLDAHANVKYMTPTSVIKATKPDPASCRELVKNLTQPSHYAEWAVRYCGNCYSPDDTDRDTFPDCIDDCEYDPNKTTPGACECGFPDTDRDGDGVVDCSGGAGGLDDCPDEPNKTSPGQCGCPGTPGSRAVGTRCTDTAGPEVNATCSAAGQCGNPTSHSPGSGCKLITWRSKAYWFCGVFSTTGRTTQANAKAACSAKGLSLVRIDSYSENLFLSRVMPAGTAWMGANSLTTAGSWRWTDKSNNNSDIFWSGSSTGKPVDYRYANWRAGSPGTQRCALLDPSDRKWVDASCTQTLGYICAYDTPDSNREGHDPPGKLNDPPVSTNPGPCVSDEDSLLPATLEQLEQDIANHTGPAANPPPEGSTCSDDPESNAVGLDPPPSDPNDPKSCRFVKDTPEKTCLTNDECPGGHLCRPVKESDDCHPAADAVSPTKEQTCATKTLCGIMLCPYDETVTRCSEVEICNPGTEFDAGMNAESLPASPLDPQSVYKNGPPDAAPSPQYRDDPVNKDGKNHTWCRMKTQDPNSVGPTESPVTSKKGGTKGNGTIGFDFEPNLLFQAEANPLALGENNMKLHAQASLVASVHLKSFLNKTYDADIIRAVAGIRAERCSVSTAETTFQIFGLDFVKLEGIPALNTSDPNSPLYSVSKSCSDALGQYQIWANRAKKAFRDAQQLLSQYHALKNGGLSFADLCEKLEMAGATVSGFPGGAVCYPGETPETTINRFIYYYQAPGIGQISRLRNAAKLLTDFTNKLQEKLSGRVNVPFIDKSYQESRTILAANFAIGPVPMTLEIELNTSYGIGGQFSMELSAPIGLSAGKTPDGAEPIPIARLRANVIPHASASLSAFVGAGYGNRLFGASVGIEGDVTLAEIQAPIFAGAGLGVSVLEDQRVLPTDVGPPVSLAADAFQFKIPKAFKFHLWYEYGASVDVANVLQGKIKGRVRIRFAFFSRTWRKQIARFNGWTWHYDLLKGGNDLSVAIGKRSVPSTSDLPGTATKANVSEVPGLEMGRSESEVPLTVLRYLDQVEPTGSPDGGVPDGGIPGEIDPLSNLTKVFYDDLCCSKRYEDCSNSGGDLPPCCPGLFCDNSAKCAKPCGVADVACADSNDCCTGLVCRSSGKCGACGAEGTACGGDGDCCSGMNCTDGQCTKPCGDVGVDCSFGYGCCEQLQCLSTGKCGQCGAPWATCGNDGDCCSRSDGYICHQDVDKCCVENGKSCPDGTGVNCCSRYCYNGTCATYVP